MKAITIKQPWASLIVKGYKKYEFRSWKTNYRGKILIHAGLSTDKKYITLFKDYNIEYMNGAIIGEAEIIDCILVNELFNERLNSLNNLVYHHDYTGLYAWELDNIKVYNEPIYIKGKLGLWNFEEK